MIRIHRFHDEVAIWFGEGQTHYINIEDAKILAEQLARYVKDIESIKFADSTIKTFKSGE